MARPSYDQIVEALESILPLAREHWLWLDEVAADSESDGDIDSECVDRERSTADAAGINVTLAEVILDGVKNDVWPPSGEDV